ncbi:WD40-repeat-containing domain protein [Thamnidium elegans]|nr:WD40-repeat-containing domain protein [Thamnidium elegans]
MVTTEERDKKLVEENRQLLERWINKMNEEAEKMNEATMFYERALEQAKAKKQLKRGSIDISVPYSSIVLPKKVTKRINVHDAEIHCISASSLGSMIATGGADKKIKLIDAKSGHILQSLSGALQTITSVSFNSTDEMILGSCTDNATRIWSLSTHRIRHTLTGHIGKVFAAKFTGDSNRVVSGSHDRTLKVWDLQKGYNIRTIFTFSSCNDLCLLDADGQTIISGHLDNNIRLWDTRTGTGIKELTGIHNGQVTSVSMSPDGSLCIWNARNGKLEKEVKEHNSVICGVSWNPTGDYLYSAEKNKTVCMWDTSGKNTK